MQTTHCLVSRYLHFEQNVVSNFLLMEVREWTTVWSTTVWSNYLDQITRNSIFQKRKFVFSRLVARQTPTQWHKTFSKAQLSANDFRWHAPSPKIQKRPGRKPNHWSDNALANCCYRSSILRPLNCKLAFVGRTLLARRITATFGYVVICFHN